MTTEHPHDDQEFDLFLAGQGDLADQLKTLPQPAPSAALDASVLSHIEQLLAQEQQAQRAQSSVVVNAASAANDAVGPSDAKPALMPLSPWWKISWGIAAGVMLTVFAQYLTHNAAPSTTVAMVTSAAKEKSAATEIKQEPKQEPKQESQPNTDQIAMNAPPVLMLPPPPPPMIKPLAPVVNAMPADSIVVATNDAPKKIVHPFAHPQVPPPMLAQASPEISTVTITGIRKGIEAAISVKPNNNAIVDSISAEDVGKLPDTRIAESLARLPGLTAARTDVTQAYDANFNMQQAPVATPAPGPAESATAAATTESQLTRAKIAAWDNDHAVSAAKLAKNDNQRQASGAVTGIRKGIEAEISVKQNNSAIVEAISAEDIGKLPDINKAKTWLANIEKQLNANVDGDTKSTSDALAEWDKFQKAYPNYPVPAPLLKQLRAAELKSSGNNLPN